MSTTSGTRTLSVHLSPERAEPEDFGAYDGPHAVHQGSLREAGVPAFCVCGWHPRNHPGFIVADHLKDMGALEG